jgi:hypothetical protein
MQKSVQLLLNFDALHDRAIYDITTFLKNENNKKNKNNITIKKVPNTLVDIKKDMTFRTISDHLNEHILAPMNKILNTSDYVSTVPSLVLENQQIVWQYRTYLFYQLLIIEAAALRNADLYHSIFSENDSKNKNNIHNIYRDDINSEEVLNKVIIGIFGSLTPTSDIDVGFEYLGKPVDGILTHIVSRFEALFYIFTNKSSLQWDIESYGNLLTLSNEDSHTKKDYPEYFYLDTTKLCLDHYKKLLKYAAASIMRNVLMYSYSRKSTDLNKNTENSKKVLNFFEDNLNIIKKFFEVDDITWIYEGEELAIEYLKLETHEADKKYYELLRIAEKTRNRIIKNKEDEKKSDLNFEFTGKDIFEIISTWAKAAIYRRENYVLSSSVIHVVRTLQANKDMREKYNTTVPGVLCDKTVHDIQAFCTIGEYGYMLSILEQLGYIMRFYNTYNNINNYNTFEKKFNKYYDRISNGILRINLIKNPKTKNNQSIYINSTNLENAIKKLLIKNFSTTTATNSNHGGARYKKTVRKKHMYVIRKKNNSKKSVKLHAHKRRK